MKNKKAFVLVIVLCIAIVVSFGACSSNDVAADAQASDEVAAEGGVTYKSQPAFVGNEDEVYYFIDFAAGVDYWSSLYEGFKDVGRQLGVQTVYAGIPDVDINAQVALFEDVLATNPAGIYLCPFNGEPFAQSLQKAKDQGVPVMLYTNPPEDAPYLGMIDHNNALDSAKAADYIGEQLGGEGEVAIMETEGQPNHIARVDYFVARLEEKWPGVKVVGTAATNHDAELGATAAKDFMTANPDLDYIFCVSSNCALGASVAVQEGNADVRIVTFDADPGVLDALKAGEIDACIQPDAYMFGYMGLLPLYIEKHQLMDPMTDQKANGQYIFDMPMMYPASRVVTAENADYYNSTLYLEGRDSKSYDESGTDMTNPDLPGYWER